MKHFMRRLDGTIPCYLSPDLLHNVPGDSPMGECRSAWQETPEHRPAHGRPHVCCRVSFLGVVVALTTLQPSPDAFSWTDAPCVGGVSVCRCLAQGRLIYLHVAAPSFILLEIHKQTLCRESLESNAGFVCSCKLQIMFVINVSDDEQKQFNVRYQTGGGV